MEHLYCRFGKVVILLILLSVFGCSSKSLGVKTISEGKWNEERVVTIKNDELRKQISKRITELKIEEEENSDPCIGCEIYYCTLDDGIVIAEEYNGYTTYNDKQGNDEKVIQSIYNELISRVPSYYIDEYSKLDIYYYEDNDILIQGEMGGVFANWSLDFVKQLSWINEFELYENGECVKTLSEKKGYHYLILEKEGVQYQLGYLIE